MSKVDIHADDYCLSPHMSDDILDCIRAGKLDSISAVSYTHLTLPTICSV